jgi:hypothetical protein|uniref:Transmembrane protein n=1 Tax=viral metagenome TaxID=1070528 RepID=A0A6C0IR97_9ZZZZ
MYMDRFDIERQLQRQEQQVVSSKGVGKQEIMFWRFNDNNNSHVFIKALFLLLLSISGGFTSKTLGCGTQKAFQNMTTKHIILFALIYFTLDISESGDAPPIHPIVQLQQSFFLYVAFVLFTKMDFFFTMISFGLLCLSYVIGNYVSHLDYNINKLQQTKKDANGDDKTINEYQILKNQSKKYQMYANYISVGVLIIGCVSYLIKKKKEYGSRFSYVTFFQGVQKCEGL